MWKNYSPLPVLQLSKTKLINNISQQMNNCVPVGTFHHFTIVHPKSSENKIAFIYLFTPSNNTGYFAFKPILNKSREVVSIIYEFGNDADFELAAMALLFLLETKLCISHPPAFEIPLFLEILNHFENGPKQKMVIGEWEWWKR